MHSLPHIHTKNADERSSRKMHCGVGLWLDLEGGPHVDDEGNDLMHCRHPSRRACKVAPPRVDCHGDTAGLGGGDDLKRARKRDEFMPQKQTQRHQACAHASPWGRTRGNGRGDVPKRLSPSAAFFSKKVGTLGSFDALPGGALLFFLGTANVGFTFFTRVFFFLLSNSSSLMSSSSEPSLSLGATAGTAGRLPFAGKDKSWPAVTFFLAEGFCSFDSVGARKLPSSSLPSSDLSLSSSLSSCWL